MSSIRLRLSEEEHINIKVQAAKTGKSMNQYTLDCIDEAKDYSEHRPIPTSHLGKPSKQELCEHGWSYGSAGKSCGCVRKTKKLPRKNQSSGPIKRSKDVKGITFEGKEVINCQKCLYPMKAESHTCKPKKK